MELKVDGTVEVELADGDIETLHFSGLTIERAVEELYSIQRYIEKMVAEAEQRAKDAAEEINKDK